MSRRAKKRHSDRGPLSGTRTSRRKQERRKAKPVLTVLPNPSSSNLVPTAAPAAVDTAPARAPESSLPSAAKLATAAPFSDEALPDVERSFFEGWNASALDLSATVVADPSPLITDDADALLLTPEQQQRRQWFRRQVTALMAGMGAFGAAAIAVRIASLL
jgi:hypothetical protein